MLYSKSFALACIPKKNLGFQELQFNIIIFVVN